ncbi:hypothetical protein [Cytobacillus horneckiae]|uniref:hypothetical protein n=1 Tax=Cytobacillus horneckiae TaxID=549687 RepID=UPI003D9A5C64
MNKKSINDFEKNKRFYSELAEQRTIKILGLNNKEINIAKAFETTKAIELNNLKKEIHKKQKEKLTWRDVLFGRFD